MEIKNGAEISLKMTDKKPKRGQHRSSSSIGWELSLFVEGWISNQLWTSKSKRGRARWLLFFRLLLAECSSPLFLFWEGDIKNGRHDFEKRLSLCLLLYVNGFHKFWIRFPFLPRQQSAASAVLSVRKWKSAQKTGDGSFFIAKNETWARSLTDF